MKNFLVISIAILSLLSTAFNSFSQLSGTYTIGQGGNYITITSAVNDLISQGVNGPVTFNIFPGNYPEQVVIDSIRGTSSVNRVIFKSSTNDTSSVLIFPTDPSKNYLIKINGADFLSFKYLNFRNGIIDSLSVLRIIDISPHSEYINFENNSFNLTRLIPYVFSYRSYVMIHSNSGNLQATANGFNTIFVGFDDKSYGIYIDNLGSVLNSVAISNNSFANFDYHITLHSVNSPLIEKNSFYIHHPPGLHSTFFGIRLFSCNDSIKVLKNMFDAEGFYMHERSLDIQLDFCTGNNSAFIGNNFFSNASSSGAISIYNSSRIKLVYNSIYCFSQLSDNIYLFNSNFIECRNNLLMNLTSDFRFGIIFDLNNSSMSSDYNNLFSNYVFAYIDGNAIYSFDSLIAYTGNDSNSNNIPVSFVSSTDLHLTGGSINNPNLLGVPVTGIIDDIDGNPRDPNKPMMGAHEARDFITSRLFLKAFIEGFYDPQTNLQIGDTINASLHSIAAPYGTVDNATGFLPPKGTAVFDFQNIPGGNYYISLHHRNSLETWSKIGGELFVNGNYTVCDFTTSPSNSFGNNLTLKGSKYCIYSGDVDQDEIIDVSDLILIFNDAMATGYRVTDVNIDGIVDLDDMLITYNNIQLVAETVKP